MYIYNNVHTLVNAREFLNKQQQQQPLMMMSSQLVMESLSLPPLPAILFTVAALAVGAFTVYFYEPSWRVRRVPGPLALPLIGHLPLLAKHGPAVFGVLAKRYGPIYR